MGAPFRLPTAASATAVALVLALGGCAGSSPAMGPTAAVTEPTGARLMKVADDTRAGGDLATAVTLYRRAHELSPQDPAPLSRLADTLARQRSYTEAVEAYRMAIAASPDDWELRRNFAAVLIALGQPEPALAQLDIAQAKHPDDPRLLNAVGVAKDLAGRHEAAQRDYQQGLARAPANPTLRNNLGLSQALSGDSAKAIATLTALAEEPGASPRVRLNLALVLGLAGQRDAAAAAARTDLDEEAITQNLSYYAMLRTMDDRSRTAAILGVPLSPDRSTATVQPTIAEAEPPAAPVPASSAHIAVEQLELPEIAPVASNPAPVAPQPAAPKARVVVAAAEVPAPAPLPAVEPVAELVTAPPPPPVRVAVVHPADPAPVAHVAEASPQPRGPVVQVGSFGTEENAKKLEQQLATKGYALSILKVTRRDGQIWYAVRAGGFASEDDAAEAARDLRAHGQPTAAVMHVTASIPAKTTLD